MEKYRHKLNLVELFGEFFYHLCQEKLLYTDDLDGKSSGGMVTVAIKVTKGDVQRLLLKRRQRKKYRMKFLNSDDGCKLRLEVPLHDVVRQRPPNCLVFV